MGEGDQPPVKMTLTFVILALAGSCLFALSLELDLHVGRIIYWKNSLRILLVTFPAVCPEGAPLVISPDTYLSSLSPPTSHRSTRISEIQVEEIVQATILGGRPWFVSVPEDPQQLSLLPRSRHNPPKPA